MSDWSEAWQHLQLHFKTALLGGGILFAVALLIGLARFAFEFARGLGGGVDSNEAVLIAALMMAGAVTVASVPFAGRHDLAMGGVVCGSVFAVMLLAAIALGRLRRAIRRMVRAGRDGSSNTQ